MVESFNAETDAIEDVPAPTAQVNDAKEVKEAAGPVMAQPQKPSSAHGLIKARYILIGGGTAAYSAMRTIQEKEPGADILILTAENYIPYMRYSPYILLIINYSIIQIVLLFYLVTFSLTIFV